MFIKPRDILKLLVLFLLQLVTGCKYDMSENVTKFEWDANESAPKHYPMEIIRGTFIYKGETERGLYIPSGGTLIAGWGRPISSHVTGEKYKPLPDKLDITFFSYAEKQFYHGKFELPYENILKYFQAGVADNPAQPTYSSIMAGIAPGGVVAVWVIGTGGYHEVFFGQAEKVDLNPSAAFALPFESKAQSDEYIHEGLIEVLKPEEIEDLKTNGIPFGLWARYRKQYQWDVRLTKEFELTYTGYQFLNGERYKKPGMILRPVPKQVAIKTVINNQERIFTVIFDEFEIMDAFEKLAIDNRPIYLEFEPRLPRDTLKARLYNDKQSIELNKYTSKK